MQVEGAGVALEVEQHGAPQGAATVLVHGMGGTDWPVAVLGAGARVITYDRRGYGASGAPEPYTATTINEQAEDLAALIRALGAAPALLVGFGFGALIVLDVLLRHAALARAAVLVDPPAYPLVAEATQGLSQERASLEAMAREGALPAHARGYLADWAGLATLELTRSVLRRIAAPVAVATTAAARPHVRAAGDALTRLVPGARHVEDWEAAVRDASA